MTISTHTRVQRGYYRRYYERTAEVRRKKAREAESNKCRYRHGWALWLIAELREVWSKQPILENQPTPDSPVIWDQWTICACAGHNKLSIGSHAKRIRSTG